MIEHTTEVVCDTGCGAALRFPEHIFTRHARQSAREYGWNYALLDGQMRDLCPACIARWTEQITYKTNEAAK